MRREGLGPERVLAAMTRLMNAAYFRVGDERYARKNKTYGIATLQRKHLRIGGDAMIFEYSGKWGKTHRKVVREGGLREVVEECIGLPGYEVFKYVDESGMVRDVKARDLNSYVKQVMGEEFTPKDFRTWAGTLIVAVKLAELGPVTESKHAEENVLGAVDAVAERLGNTRDIARLVHQPAGHRPLSRRLRGSLPRGASRRDHSRRTGRPDRRRESTPGSAEQGASSRAREGRVREDREEGREEGHRNQTVEEQDGAPGGRQGRDEPEGSQDRRRPGQAQDVRALERRGPPLQVLHDLERGSRLSPHL